MDKITYSSVFFSKFSLTLFFSYVFFVLKIKKKKLEEKAKLEERVEGRIQMNGKEKSRKSCSICI